MRPKIFALGSAASLLLCLATAVLWVRNQKHASAVVYEKDGLTTSIAIIAGGIEVGRAGSRVPDELKFDPSPSNIEFLDDPDFEHVMISGRDPSLFYYLSARTSVWRLPLWPIVMVELILPLAWIILRKTKRRQACVCSNCNYNLTANVSGICPECGSPTPTHPPTPSPASRSDPSDA